MHRQAQGKAEVPDSTLDEHFGFCLIFDTGDLDKVAFKHQKDLRRWMEEWYEERAIISTDEER